MDRPSPGAGGRDEGPTERPSRRGCRATAVVVLVLAGALLLPATVAILLGSWVLGSLGSLDPGFGQAGCRQSEVELVRMAAFGHVEDVREELDGDADPNALDDAGNSPLACAGPKGHAEVVELLLDAGADVDTIARDGDPVVQDAAIHCQPAVLAVLLDREPDPDALDPALARSARRADVRSVRLLLDHGADPDAYDDPGELFEEEGENCIEPSPDERAFVLDLLLSAGADPTAVLHGAVRQNLTDNAVRALAAGADPDAPILEAELSELVQVRPGSTSPLVLAITGEDPEMARLLLAAGADPNLVADAPIESAVCPDDPSDCAAVAALLDLTPLEQRPQDLDEERDPLPVVATTPLLEASWNGDVALVEALLAAGADPDGPGAFGFTPLHAAAAAGDQEVVAALFAAGAFPSHAGARLPSDLAEHAGHSALAAFLRALSA